MGWTSEDGPSRVSSVSTSEPDLCPKPEVVLTSMRKILFSVKVTEVLPEISVPPLGAVLRQGDALFKRHENTRRLGQSLCSGAAAFRCRLKTSRSFGGKSAFRHISGTALKPQGRRWPDPCRWADGHSAPLSGRPPLPLLNAEQVASRGRFQDKVSKAVSGTELYCQPNVLELRS